MAKAFFALIMATFLYGVEGVLIPFYHFPHLYDQEVHKLISFKKSYPDINFLAIVNPDNGDFSKVQYNFALMIRKLRDANISVLGYVYSSYGQRDLSQLKSRIDAWKKYKYWGVEGIFVDEVNASKQKYAYYKNLSNYIKKDFLIVVLNPGAIADKAYETIADIIVVREHNQSQKNSSDIEKSALLLHGIEDFSNIKKDLATYCYVYVTDRNGSNPWDRLSKHMPKLLQFIKEQKAALIQ